MKKKKICLKPECAICKDAIDKLRAENAELRRKWIRAYQLYSSLLHIKKEAAWLFEGKDGAASLGDDYFL